MWGWGWGRGLNLINLEHYMQSKHIKFIYKITNSRYENWNVIGKQWLRVLDEKFKIETFLTKCSSLKNLEITILSNFCKEAITSWVIFQSKIKTMDRESILDEHINGNDRILFRNTLLWFGSFSKQGIQKINDIWDENLNNFINNDCVMDKLVDKQSGVRLYNIIISSISEQWLNTLQNTQVTENNNRETITTSNSNKLKINLRTNSIEPRNYH